ncbi:MAG: DUF4160 domain-containing protein [Deltaproteobacteria bacterium]|nr:DUF4160 domain-containing protein [Deltaproteobacteria bacterium]
MPTVLRVGSYRFFFYATDRDEPMHVHVECGDNVAKFWVDPVRLQNSHGFNRSELNRIYDIIKKHHEKLKKAWNDYFNY